MAKINLKNNMQAFQDEETFQKICVEFVQKILDFCQT